jgi:hypothetical protein
VSAPPAKADASTVRPTVRLESAQIPSRPAAAPARASQQVPAITGDASKAVMAPPAAAPVAASSGPTWVDAVLGLVAMAVSGVVAYLLYETGKMQ